MDSWRRRTNEEYRASAQRYLDAEDDKERETIFKETGIRWSELLRLPYFDPSRFVVVDAMHNLFLGLIKEHFEILGIRDPEDEKKQDRLCTSNPNLGKLLLCPSPCVCSTISHFQRLGQTEFSSDAAIDFDKGCVLTVEEVATMRSDIANMATPSWLASVPYDLGAARHGKLKADQWRILATIHLPVSLQKLWDTHSPRSTPLRKKLLDATMALISAVVIATAHKTSRNMADLYLQHMQSYLQLMQELLPRYNFCPNHHMALHLAEYLRFFGPVHAWWTFPFERLIGMLERMPTNFKMGKLLC
ncbi:hypothetical protein HYPSUDRAFT_139897 [Hypholoma sublateritium FD-334 SS-4]|uniref:DUF4218 domain-containing protein n=1 Tax=Hypholoma sublateritium (strain FD-334 SS-4) TaxID=945553 RepID=A0A0D2PPS8_HYPSF|nr:hypothetical protein HYPSUDRAFT_139897 [Hypholoma sublateritium FD-334 SS-4]